MSCDTNKFVITRGSDNTFIFTVKQDNSTLPLRIHTADTVYLPEETVPTDPYDTFFADLVALETGTAYAPVTNKALVVEDTANGKLSLTILSSETTDETGVGGIIGLIKEEGSKVDRYYLRPTYKLTLRCNTVNNGNFIVKVPEVYVD